MTRIASAIFSALCLLAPAVGVAQWRYDYEYDQIRDYQRQHARLTSANQVNFGAPYQGGSRLSLLIRRGQFGETAVMVGIDRGQFSCGRECRWTMRFDDEEATFSFVRSTDGAANLLFIDNEAEFLRMLGNAKRLLLEATFYQEGKRVFTFNLQPLRWPPLPAKK